MVNTKMQNQELQLHQNISALMREFRLEPGMLVGSPYADLRANDIALFELLAGTDNWTVRGIAKTLSAPISTVSSALDRLERHRLISRARTDTDRRIVHVRLTARGKQLAHRLHAGLVINCRAMLGRLTPPEREELLRLVAKVVQPVRAET